MSNITTAGIEKKGLPEGFVYIDEYIEDCIIDAKYAGTDNLFGCPIDGYNKALVVCTKEVADALVKAADILREKGYVLKIFDSYRPQMAVDHFCRWGEDVNDQRRKPVHYPKVDKKRMFEEGYISKKSYHTRGGAVDLTLVDIETNRELDMGTIFDFMDIMSHPSYTGLTTEQLKNRALLREAMLSSGFKPIESEWWHFDLVNEPYPDTYFNFPIE